MVAASKTPEGTPSRFVASPSRYSTLGAGRACATRSISFEKSIPSTPPPLPTLLARSRVRLPVPQARSMALSPARSPVALMTSLFQRRLSPAVITVLSSSWRPAIRSNISLTSRARSIPAGSRFSRRSPIRVPHFPRRLADTRLRPLLALVGDYVQETSQVRRPELQGDPFARGDTPRAIPDHAARNRHKPGLVEAGYGLDRPRVGVVADEDLLVRRAVSRGVVILETSLQIIQRVGDHLGPVVFPGQVRGGNDEDVPERDVGCPADGLLHLSRPLSGRTTRRPPRRSFRGPPPSGRSR